MTLQEMKELLDAEVFVGHDKLGLDITKAGCADSMADVRTFGQKGMLLLTGLTVPDVIQTAYSIGIAAIIIVRGKHPLSETVKSPKNYRFQSFQQVISSLKPLVGYIQRELLAIGKRSKKILVYSEPQHSKIFFQGVVYACRIHRSAKM